MDDTWMIFKHYRELVRPADAQKWYAVAPAAVEATKEVRRRAAESLQTATMPNNVVPIKVAA